MTSRELLESISVIVAVDGKLADEEKKYLLSVARQLGVSKDEVGQIFDKVRAGRGVIATPRSIEDQVDLCAHLVKAAASDGEISVNERRILNDIWERFGVGGIVAPNEARATAKLTERNRRTEMTEKSVIQKSKGIRIFWPIVMLIAIITAWLYVVRMETPVPSELPAPPEINVDSQDSASRQKFYAEEIKPLLASTQEQNEAAVARCVKRIEESIDKYRKGVDPFVEELTSWGTRWQVMKRMPVDWWRKETQVDDYVRQLFEKHVMKEGKLEEDLTVALAALKEDLDANGNSLLISAKASAQTSDMPSVKLPEYAQYSALVQKQMKAFSTGRGQDSVRSAIASLIAGEAAGMVATQIVVQVISRFGTELAVAGAVGATGAAGGVGAAGGSTLGPVGTAVGMGVGLVVGIVADWWVTDGFKEKLTTDLNGYLSKMEASVIDGTGESEGIKSALGNVCNDIYNAQQLAMHECVVGSVQ